MATPAPYEQRHAAVTGFVRTLGALGGALVVGAVVVVVLLPTEVGAAVCVLMVFVGLFPAGYAVVRTVQLFPAGFRIDADGVTIGWLDGLPLSVVRPMRQADAAFHAPWSQIRRVEVITDESQLEELKRMARVAYAKAPRRMIRNYGTVPDSRGTGVGVGQFWQPFTRACLMVVLVDSRSPAVSSPRYLDVPGQGILDFGVWLIPVRGPQEVRRVLTEWHRAGRTAANGLRHTVGPVDPPSPGV